MCDSPASGRNNPTAIDNVVVFPAPLGPTSPKNDHGGTVNPTPSTTQGPQTPCTSPSTAMLDYPAA